MKYAIARRPGATFADGLTSVDLGKPDVEKALLQHGRYCEAFERCGVQMTVLDADLRYPDSTFVEDTAVVVGARAIISRPGASSRRGEAAEMRRTLARFFDTMNEIVEPGTLDGGDICQADGHVFIGISQRTNEEGARQLSQFLAAEGRTSSRVEVRKVPGLLHLTTGMSYIGNRLILAIADLAKDEAFADYDVIAVDPDENYAANCLAVNGKILVPVGFPRIAASLNERGLAVETIDMSEFRKQDGALSCLSLRF